MIVVVTACRAAEDQPDDAACNRSHHDISVVVAVVAIARTWRRQVVGAVIPDHIVGCWICANLPTTSQRLLTCDASRIRRCGKCAPRCDSRSLPGQSSPAAKHGHRARPIRRVAPLSRSTAIAQFRDEHAVVRHIDREMVDAAHHVGQYDGELLDEWRYGFPRRAAGGEASITANGIARRSSFMAAECSCGRARPATHARGSAHPGLPKNA